MKLQKQAVETRTTLNEVLGVPNNIYYHAFVNFKKTVRGFVFNNDFKEITISSSNLLLIYASYAQTEEEIFLLGAKFYSILRQTPSSLLVDSLVPLTKDEEYIYEKICLSRGFSTLFNINLLERNNLKLSIEEALGFSKEWKSNIINNWLEAFKKTDKKTENLISILTDIEYQSKEELLAKGVLAGNLLTNLKHN